MRASQWFLSTLKENPHDAEVVSHQLMLRAGMIRKLGSGLYTWLPLGLKVLRKIEQIVREEMNRAQAIEVLMPAIQPAELWEETKRWDTFGGQLLKMQDSNGRSYCFGPTHEEVITDLIRHEFQSYKQLPANFYQIQTKFRDEIRPRFGVMRAREFIMKDAYSFHLTESSLQETYNTIYATYGKILARLGLTYRAVEADTGAIGGAMSHEFQVLADSGEDIIFYSDASDYAANVEQASSLPPPKATSLAKEQLTLIKTPGKKTIAEVANFLQVSAKETVKTLIVIGETDSFIALILRGDDELNEIKAAKHPLVKSPLQFADDEAIKTLNLAVGYLGPVKLGIPIIADHHALAMRSFVCGANEADLHYLHAAWGRDAQYQEAFDLRMVKEGDLSPDGKGKLKACRGIEVGHVFQLGDKYAQAMQARVVNEEGQLQTLVMGCYGLGISRLVAATIEQSHDEHGIIWPEAIAPFQIIIIPINASRVSAVKEVAESLYQELLTNGFDVLLDDRNERPGVLFADSELIGIPHRVVISERHIKNNQLEYKARRSTEAEYFPLQEAICFLKEKLFYN